MFSSAWTSIAYVHGAQCEVLFSIDFIMDTSGITLTVPDPVGLGMLMILTISDGQSQRGTARR